MDKIKKIWQKKMVEKPVFHVYSVINYDYIF